MLNVWSSNVLSLTLSLFVGISSAFAEGAFDPSSHPNAALGLGYDTVRTEVRGECVEGEEAPSDSLGENQLFSLLEVENSKTLQDLLKVSASASLAGSIGGLQGKASLIQSVQVNSYSIYLLASVLVEQPPKRLSKAKLSTNASLLLSSKGPSEFRVRCGDEYISGWVTGGEYHAIIEIDTESTEDR
jgi:hypothetical protein